MGTSVAGFMEFIACLEQLKVTKIARGQKF